MLWRINVAVLGVGTDVAPVARFARLTNQAGLGFLDRWFTPAEVRDCLSRSDPARQVAAYFAAKEATFKSLRATGDGPLRWREIEITHEAQGQPCVSLGGTIRALANQMGVKELHLSIALAGPHVFATVIAVT